jgi:hypothetical protein
MPSLVPTFRLNPEFTKRWQAAIHELAAVAKKESPENIHKLVTLSARRFVKNVANITPPATGLADSSAKKRGEAAILVDLLKLAIPATVAGSARAAREALTTAEELMAAHERARRGAAGRVNPRNRKEKLFVSQSTFNRVLTALQARVGWLAAGLNAAAERLGFHLPAWIRRHGQRFGAIEVAATASSIRVRVVQNVPYADDVRGYARRWDFALLKEIHALEAQVKAIHQRATHRARGHLK